MTQHFQTQPDICRYMVSMLPNFVETVLEPTPGEGNLVEALKERQFMVVAPEDFWQVDDRAWFDTIVMNPPFSPMKTGYEILERCMGMTNRIVALMPWLTLINSEERTSRIQKWGLVSVTHLPRNAFPGSRVQTCILEMVRGYQWDAKLYFYEREKKDG